MKLEFSAMILFATIFLFPCIAATSCNRTCGLMELQFPFGFSPGCKIQLNCSANAMVLAPDFPVLSVTRDTILISLRAICGRPLEAVGRLFTQNYAPNSLNAILLQNCSARPSACFMPMTTLKANFQLIDCSKKNDNISCYSEMSGAPFMDYNNLTRSGCRSLLSAISMRSFTNSYPVSLDVEVVRIGWWLMGECRCSENARCVRISPPVDGNPSAYRCQCAEGFAGDGFLDGLGCWRAFRRCNAQRYLSGQCGGKTRVAVLVIGGVAAGASLIAISYGLIFCFIRERSKLRSRNRKKHQIWETRGINIPVYPYKDMEKATDFFSEVRRLGNGAYGTVYSGKLTNDEQVAVKRIKHRDTGTIEQVINEIKLLSSVSHPNLVRLLGCSIENEEQILVYEFMPNGPLSQHLQRRKGSAEILIPWQVRLNIAVETAQAISYLHNEIHPPVYHRDIKSSNILLDCNYKSKVADFGLSRLGMIDSSHVSTTPQGTPGYLDPQYHQHFRLSDKSDVYSFGVVLIEIITALKVVDFNRPPDHVNLTALAVDMIGRGCLEEIIDPYILEPERDSWTVSSVHKVAELALRCLNLDKDMRPSMMEVAIELEQIRLSNKSLNGPAEKEELGSICEVRSMNSMDTEADFSPVSVKDPCQSEESTTIIK